MISPVSRLMAMTRPSGRLASTLSSHSAMPRVREVLPSCGTPGSVDPRELAAVRVARVDLVDRAPAVARVHEAVVDERVGLVLGAVLPDVLHAAERHGPHHAHVPDVLAVDLRQPRVAQRPVVAVHQQPVLRLVVRVDEAVLVDGQRVLRGQRRRGNDDGGSTGKRDECPRLMAHDVSREVRLILQQPPIGSTRPRARSMSRSALDVGEHVANSASRGSVSLRCRPPRSADARCRCSIDIEIASVAPRTGPPRAGAGRHSTLAPMTAGFATTAGDARSGRHGGEVQVLRDPRAVLAEGIGQQPDPPLRLVQIRVIEVDVEQVDVPRQLHRVADVGLDDLARDGQRGALRDVVDVAVAGVAAACRTPRRAVWRTTRA